MILYSTKRNGNMSQKYSDNGRANRLAFFEQNHIDVNRTLCMKCPNANLIKEATSSDLNKINANGTFFIEGDAIFTREDIFIYQLFGDCIPMVIYDEKQKIISLVHLGWISTNNDFHIKVVDYFIKELHSNIENMYIYIGPSIKSDNYIVEDPIQLTDEKWQPYLKHIENNSYCVDMLGYVLSGLKQMHIKHIEINPIDTYSDDNMFSNHRSKRENKENGRFLFGVKL